MADRLTADITRYTSSKGATRLALSAVLQDTVLAGIAERSRLELWLNEKWDWFERNPNSPRFTEREDSWIERLGVYEGICDGIAAAERALQSCR